MFHVLMIQDKIFISKQSEIIQIKYQRKFNELWEYF